MEAIHCNLTSVADAKVSGSRLVMVSNRVDNPHLNRRQGGLSVAIAETQSPAGTLWFGWSGAVGNGVASELPSIAKGGLFSLATIDLTRAELDGYYNGFANQCLWPLLHYRPDLVHFDRASLRCYEQVNRRFAAALAQLLRPDDTIWVHDFHLLPLGTELRRLGMGQRIGFYLHVPFPAPEVVTALPEHRRLFRQALDYDLLGFQTECDLRCFCAYAERELQARTDDGELIANGRRVKLRAIPVGIDVQAFAELCETREVRSQAARLQTSLAGRAMIVGVDRLDYTKGLPNRLMAYKRFLDTRPEKHNKVVLTQIAPPTREGLDPYARIRQEVDRLESLIHGEFAEFDWTPIHYIRRQIGRHRLAALYRVSSVALVTPLRDGMNLVAKEFVAAQDPTDPGVLVLSRFAGAARTMTDALIVNPHDIDGVANALYQALEMPLDERRARHDALLAQCRLHDVHAWRDAFVDSLAGSRTEAEHSGVTEADADHDPLWKPPQPWRREKTSISARA